VGVKRPRKALESGRGEEVSDTHASRGIGHRLGARSRRRRRQPQRDRYGIGRGGIGAEGRRRVRRGPYGARVSSLRALVCDELGYDPDLPARPSVSAAAAVCEAGQIVAAEDRGALVAVVRLDDGRAFIVDDTCPHDGGLLSDGYVEGDRLVCARHNWEFDPTSGQCDRRAACIAARPLGQPVLVAAPTRRRQPQTVDS
jgi:nitrite reductase/ring-hydroxylating ferredoxin subunit